MAVASGIKSRSLGDRPSSQKVERPRVPHAARRRPVQNVNARRLNRSLESLADIQHGNRRKVSRFMNLRERMNGPGLSYSSPPRTGHAQRVRKNLAPGRGRSIRCRGDLSSPGVSSWSLPGPVRPGLGSLGDTQAGLNLRQGKTQKGQGP